jgi:ectoine hydroxylase-related dioxygenase (phytanoyl-CoA dioxygenase family)
MRDLSSSEIKTHTRNLEVVGYTVVRGLLERPQADTLADAIYALERGEIDRSHGSLGRERPTDRYVLNLQNKDKRFIDLLGHRGLEAILMARLNDEYYGAMPSEEPNYILGELIARSSGNPLRLHIDSWMPAAGGYTWMMQVGFLLEDREIEEGCSLVVPGSHLTGLYTDREFPAPIPVGGRAGDVVLWDARLWHGALPRKTERAAWAIFATLQRWWVKPRYDIARGLPDEMYRQLTDRQKVLCGYASVPPLDEIESTRPNRASSEADEVRRRIVPNRRDETGIA